MFATIKNLIPEPRQADQPRRYVGRHRHLEADLPAGRPELPDPDELPSGPGPVRDVERPPAEVDEPVAAGVMPVDAEPALG